MTDETTNNTENQNSAGDSPKNAEDFLSQLDDDGRAVVRAERES